MKIKYSKKVYLNRLSSWEDELETNKHNLQHIADRCIRLLKKDIKRLFPNKEQYDE